MTPTALAPPFARRMAPLALLAGLIFGVLLPAGYATLALGERGAEAALWARHLAGELERLGRARPTLWPYDTPALNAAADLLVRPPIEARVSVDARHEDVFTAGPADRPDEVSGWAPVRVDGRVAGRVEVGLDARPVRERTRLLWIGALLGGGLLAAALYFLPVGTVRRGDAQDADLWRALQEANANLEGRVAARTEELRAREAELSAIGAQLVAVQEEERARISRDLHDELGQTLTGLRLRLTTLANGPVAHDPIGLGHLEAALQAVDAGVEQVRDLAHRLRPAALDGLGLSAALRSHAEQWAAQAGVALTSEMPEHDPPPDLADVFFRVAQEALTNIVRHAHAKNVRLTLGPFDDGWRLLIEDDGRGLPPPDPSRRRGLGLVGARERVERAGGYLDVEDATPPARGVSLVAWLPPP